VLNLALRISLHYEHRTSVPANHPKPAPSPPGLLDVTLQQLAIELMEREVPVASSGAIGHALEQYLHPQLCLPPQLRKLFFRDARHLELYELACRSMSALHDDRAYGCVCPKCAPMRLLLVRWCLVLALWQGSTAMGSIGVMVQQCWQHIQRGPRPVPAALVRPGRDLPPPAPPPCGQHTAPACAPRARCRCARASCEGGATPAPKTRRA